MIITRFAPSPTGTLHIGGVRTALFNYIYAKQNNGKFLVRIEDTDQVRSKTEFEENIITGLHDMGLKPDADPVRQSERKHLYLDAAHRIIESGQGYYCNCSTERLEELRNAQMKAGKKPMYDGKCRDKGLEKSENTVLRLKTPNDGEVRFNDLVRGEVVFNNSELDDLILLRSNGTPTYHLCVVVDDADQGVTTVIRGEDHLSNTPRQMHIQQALELSALEYAHLPLVLGENKKRLSKRDSVTSLDEYISKGYLQTSMINMLGRLGWSKGDKEIFYIDDLLKDFRIQEVQKAGAVFDLKKLDWINTNHLANLSLEDFIIQLNPYLDELGIKTSNRQNAETIIENLRTTASTLSEIAIDLIPYFADIKEYDQKSVEKFIAGSKNILEYVLRQLEPLDQWTEQALDEVLAKCQKELDLKTPQLNQPIRVALVGSVKSPSLGLTLSLIGKELSLERIKKGLEMTF
ncbi:MAG: glutamate--tRNA ligase [Gammaproteobacteria bacterium TMED104]|nr:MAG: glutamate--tRNA ligase [Gammaproteobacteria bacterium TMED104]|tara:strand:+ start:3400 stop:4785 length:1386 start_codon:yes stop_codon:yes gene_type:complete